MGELRSVGSVVGYLMHDDQMMVGLDGNLDVIADDAGIHRLELAAVDRDAGLREQANHAAQRNEASAHLADGSAIVLAEVGNRLVIRYKPARQPHHLNVARSLTLEPSTRLNPIEIAVNVELHRTDG